jgi:hypothetical protein
MLHIYDLGHDDKIQGVNALLKVMGTGAFHAGVEVYQEEWSFGFVEKGSACMFTVEMSQAPGRNGQFHCPAF